MRCAADRPPSGWFTSAFAAAVWRTDEGGGGGGEGALRRNDEGNEEGARGVRGDGELGHAGRLSKDGLEARRRDKLPLDKLEGFAAAANQTKRTVWLALAYVARPEIT